MTQVGHTLDVGCKLNYGVINALNVQSKNQVGSYGGQHAGQQYNRMQNVVVVNSNEIKPNMRKVPLFHLL